MAIKHNNIQLCRWPSLGSSRGLKISMTGDHKKLMAYTVKISAAKPIFVRLIPDSCSQMVSIEPIITQGKPCAIPNRKILATRLSRKTANLLPPVGELWELCVAIKRLLHLPLIAFKGNAFVDKNNAFLFQLLFLSKVVGVVGWQRDAPAPVEHTIPW